MPCMCYFTPEKEDQQKIKNLCKELVDMVKRLEKIGDPIDCDIKSIHKLIDHLYTGECDEKHDGILSPEWVCKLNPMEKK